MRSVVDKTYSTHYFHLLPYHSLMNGRVEYQDGLASEGGLFSTRYTYFEFFSGQFKGTRDKEN